MSRSWIAFLVLVLTSLMLTGVRAQTTAQAQQGDPPILSLITVSPPDEDGMVTVEGSQGAVFPNSRVAVRNLFSEQTVYVQAGITGSFRATLFGPGNTPFWVSPMNGNVPQNLLDVPGSLPGGPGTIVYGSLAETADTAPVTQIDIDADLSDWTAFPNARFLDGRVFALRNQQSLYMAVASLPAGTVQLQMTVTIDANTYELLLAPREAQSATLRQVAPFERDFGIIRVPKAVDGNAEIRLRISNVADNARTVTLNEIRALGDENAVLDTIQVNETLEPLDTVDGIPHPNSVMRGNSPSFSAGGAVAQGAGYWYARGRADHLDLSEDSPVHLELDVTFEAPELPDEPLNLRMIGRLSLQPVVATTENGVNVVPGINSANGYSTVLTPSGLAIDNVISEIPLTEATAEAAQILQSGNTLMFGLNFELTLPEDVPPGMYIPVLHGFTKIDTNVFPWEANGPLGEGEGISRYPQSRLPIVLNVGDVTEGRLLWTLFQDDPNEGRRGIIADEDAAYAALSNRVGFESPTYILPPTTGENGRPAGYPLEPYLLNQMPNAFQTTTSPLIPLLLPGGRLQASITQPDGTVNDLGSAAIAQSQLSTSATDERERFGSSVPIDEYRLTTLNPTFGEYPFTQYGDYTINLTGMTEDVWGNRYTGGGTYHLTIAEPLDLTPGVLPGTPFEVGDAFNPVLHLSPAVQAEVTITVRVYPLDGSEMRENVLVGRANRFGYFHTIEEVLRFDTPGEYTVDYNVRYLDGDDRLWAGSLRSAGVIANPDSTLVMHGARGLAEANNELEQAWFNAVRYAQVIGLPSRAPLRPNFPYFGGDVAWIGDGTRGGLMPASSLQDAGESYESWLLASLPDGLQRRVTEDALPIEVTTNADFTYGPALAPDRIVNEAYTYFSAVRPGLSVQQFVLGGIDPTLPLALDAEDHLNGQIGAGMNGLQPDDYVFLFGGTVVRNEEAQIDSTVLYGAMAVVVPEDDERGARVYPPFRGETGGGDGGALLNIRDNPVDMFFYPSGIQPGDVLIQGDVMAIAGHVAPTLPSIVSVTITSPGGVVRQFEGIANAVGYFYDPSQDFAVDEIGLWTVDIDVRHEGLTSAGLVEPPLPSGIVPGTEDGRYTVYVVPQNATRLAYDRTDSTFPASTRFNFTVPLPLGWTNRQVYYTVTMPGYLIEQGTLPITGTAFTYPYDPSIINRNFPNFEVASRTTGAAISDPITLTFTVTGTDDQGRFQVSSRKMTLFHDRLITLED